MFESQPNPSKAFPGGGARGTHFVRDEAYPHCAEVKYVYAEEKDGGAPFQPGAAEFGNRVKYLQTVLEYLQKI